tara:strand:- start:24 stop:560 length:537 start_codon:yes stop_codon:yes gene_type:complete
MNDKKIGIIKMRNTYNVFKTTNGYKVSSTKDVGDRNEYVEFIPIQDLKRVEYFLPTGEFDIDKLYSLLQTKHIPHQWKYHYGRDGRKQKFYLQKILCVLIVKGIVKWEKVGRKFMYTFFQICPECDGTHVAKIVYGLPSEETIREVENMKKRKQERFVLGGCVVQQAQFFCHQCKYSW